METSSSSFVSKAKIALHSAAAKAEKVLTDIKADFKNDREESEEESHKYSRQMADQEKLEADAACKIQTECNHECKHSRWKSTYLGKKQDLQHLQHRLMNMKRGTKDVVEEKAKNLTSDIPALDKDLNQMDQENMCKVKDSERGSTGAADDSNSSNKFIIPPASIIKQLGMAIESGKNFKSLKDLVPTSDSSLIKEKAGLSFSAVKSLVLREKEEKSTSEFVDNEEVLSLIRSLFDTEEHFLRRKNGSGYANLSMSYFPSDIHGAPPESFVVRLSEIIGSFKTLRKMASFWDRVIAELRSRWSEGIPVPCMPLDKIPDLNYCLLHQQLQVINCCVARKRRRTIATDTLDSIVREASTKINDSGISISQLSPIPIICARISSGDLVLRLGADHPSENLAMLETGEPVFSPVTQEGPLLTEDLIRETEEFVLRTGSVGAGCSQLLSDMQAFKAANPGCILEDFVRWHSPPDWTEGESSDEIEGSPDGGDLSSKRGQLSSRMQKEGNLWRELWETAKPLPVVKQAPLFDEDLAVENILNILEDIPPSELLEQLFVSVLSAGFAIAEDAIAMNNNFSKLFYDCKDYVVSVCQGELVDNIDDLCQVYETVETILVHPEESLKIMHSEETTTGESNRRFKKISLNFVGRISRFYVNHPQKIERNRTKAVPVYSPNNLMQSPCFRRSSQRRVQKLLLHH
ncbi:rab3 GTPase-activating protein catalytic subunit isoform X2 [Tasmannia lanceolata]|uniref:rab3 GTPase-activating protein catalytic subunit isoform X2 n=1 Tax=Tasmannia lanceolata TaxID=3420 RepID=UPI0040636DC1